MFFRKSDEISQTSDGNENRIMIRGRSSIEWEDNIENIGQNRGKTIAEMKRM